MKKLTYSIALTWALMLWSVHAGAAVRVAIEAAGDNRQDSIPYIETLLDNNGFEADIVTASDIDTAAEISQYNVVLIGDSGHGDNDWAQFDATLEEFVANGGGLLASGWVPYFTTWGSAESLRQLLPVSPARRYSYLTRITPTAISHPITNGLSPWVTASYNNYGGGVKPGATVLANDSFGNASVVVWDYGSGKVVHLAPNYLVAFHHYRQQAQLNGSIPDAQAMFFNAIDWAAGNVNEPPVAVCADVVVSASGRGSLPTAGFEYPQCEADASIDAGSYDPDGDPITLSQSPSGPYTLGDTLVELTVEDEPGDTDTCQAIVTVIDDSPPVPACVEGVNPSGKNKPKADNQDGFFQVSALDNCSAGSDLTISIGGVELADGETIKITQAPGKQGVRFVNTMGPARIRHFLVGPGDAEVAATDASGNTASVLCEVPPK